MNEKQNDAQLFESGSVIKVLMKIAPPIMFAQLIQALYNLVDSYFVGKFSDDGLTALSVIYPLQLVIVAFAVGTGVGVNTYMAQKYALKQNEKANAAAGTGMILSIVTWAVFALLSALLMPLYVRTGASTEGAINAAVTYGNIVCVGSLATFMEGNWTKVHQAQGKMTLPMIAQVAGALTNVVMDPLLIFGVGPFPKLGVAGAAYATVIGQVVSAVIVGVKGVRKPPKLSQMWHYVKHIYKLGYSSIGQQLLYTVYIALLNAILAGFSESAVTVLGLYYKEQSFFFIPLFGLQTAVVPMLSYNYAKKDYDRCKKTLNTVLGISAVTMIIGTACFTLIPVPLLKIFSSNAEVIEIGKVAFPEIGASFLPVVLSLTFPMFYQAIGQGGKSIFLSLLRQVVCLVPIFWALSLIGLNYSWWAFVISECISGGVGLLMYLSTCKKWKLLSESQSEAAPTVASENG